MMSHSCRRDCGSSPVVGSSRNSSSGSPTRAQATASRCFCPPESLPTQARRFLLERDAARSPRPARALAIEAAKQRERLADGELFGEPGFLQRDADALRGWHRRRSPQRRPSTSTSPRRGIEQPFEDLDGGGLAGAVGAEQAEALAVLRLSRSSPRTASTGGLPS